MDGGLQRRGGTNCTGWLLLYVFLLTLVYQRRAASKTIFGVPLPHTIPTGAQIPTIVDQCIKYIEERGAHIVHIKGLISYSIGRSWHL